MSKNTPSKQIADFLPKALEISIEKYHDFLNEKHNDVTDFKKRQEACKVAIAHIQLLIKLVTTSEPAAPQSTEIEREALQEIMRKAHAEVEEYNRSKEQEKE